MTDAHEPTQQEALPFSLPKQEALMGYLLTDPKFFRGAKPRINKGWWSSLRLQQIWDIVVKLANQYQRPMTVPEITESRAFLAMDPAEATKLRSGVAMCVSRRTEFGLDMLQQDLTDWLRCRIYLESMKKSESLFNLAAKGGGQDRARLVAAFDEVKAMTKAIDEATFEAGQVEEMSIADIDQAATDSTKAIAFGIPCLDSFMNNGNACGLLKGDMTVLLAPSNIGKTTAMITTVAVNLVLGHDVLFIAHEGRTADLKMKIWQAMMESSRPDLMTRRYEPEFRARLEEMERLMKEHLIFMPMPKAGLPVEDVDVAVRRQQDLWKASHLGKGFDVLVDDYAAKLTTNQARGGQFALRHIHEVVYNYFSQMALEHDFHVLTAIQANREGSKMNSRVAAKGVESRFLVMEDVAEAWGPMTTATNVISLNRPPSAKAVDVTGFYLCKSRSSETGVVFMAQSNFAKARTHWPTYSAQQYKTYSAGGQIDDLLKDFGGLHVGEADEHDLTPAQETV